MSDSLTEAFQGNFLTAQVLQLPVLLKSRNCHCPLATKGPLADVGPVVLIMLILSILTLLLNSLSPCWNMYKTTHKQFTLKLKFHYKMRRRHLQSLSNSLGTPRPSLSKALTKPQPISCCLFTTLISSTPLFLRSPGPYKWSRRTFVETGVTVNNAGSAVINKYQFCLFYLLSLKWRVPGNFCSCVGPQEKNLINILLPSTFNRTDNKYK